MSEHRKPPLEQNSRDDSPPPPLPSDSGGFSIESTTMRLNSLRLRRVEKANEEVEKAIAPKSDSVEMPPGSGNLSAGRVRHDERGMAVWDWAVTTGEVAALSPTNVMQKLDTADLKIEETPTELKTPSAGSRDKGGGFDPYNQLADKPVVRPERERLVPDLLTPKKK